ncbi:Malonyl-CoA O-methyltransferase BioC [Piscirickettsia salmonis]|uniref:malonyl-ACP O-methyltransferase BioC n=1 Tax=Piscirickettsia salmonis TaxID=1238 RepID=UPI0012BB11C1|nr:malonyl-ACP O-methyltransferase BioC [Piscirickettsia salmonis]QGP56055.1 Malonyl-CoA O-methyltransferase BioC [Piscirickettsia salmonis]QGP58074.1 Malonyl-CoA O-methyltransferase BioC [Piscirickettsia salmonis]QGP65625.1 Malonyl-CoA O-methyltransferase BioC [Piscirickettsia salmonis]
MIKQQFNKKEVCSAFNQAACGYQAAAILQVEIAKRLDERLDFVHLSPERIVDLGAGTGVLTRHMKARFSKAQVVGLDLAEKMLRQARRQDKLFKRNHWIAADIEHLPFMADSLDLITSSSCLHWVSDLVKVLSEVWRVLKPGSLFTFTTFGPDTLKELKASFSQVDDHPHVNAFIDMHDIGDLLLKQGFADPVMDMEYIQMTYTDVMALMGDLKTIGANNHARDKRQGLMGRGVLERVKHAYEQYRTSEGVLPATFEVIYGHAWVPEQKQRLNSGEVLVSLESLKK